MRFALRFSLILSAMLMVFIGMSSCGGEDDGDPRILISEIMLKNSRESKMYIHGNETILKGTKLQLETIITPDDATNTVLEWESSNEKVATVDENGVVTAIGIGTTTILCKATDGSKISASCQLEVVNLKGHWFGDLDMYIDGEKAKVSEIEFNPYEKDGMSGSGVEIDHYRNKTCTNTFDYEVRDGVAYLSFSNEYLSFAMVDISISAYRLSGNLVNFHTMENIAYFNLRNYDLDWDKYGYSVKASQNIKSTPITSRQGFERRNKNDIK